MGSKLALLTISLLLTSAALAAAASAPRLSLVDRTAVKGRSFQPHATLRVVIVTDKRRVVQVRASGTGAFIVQLPAPYDACSGLTVSALVGSRVAALLKLPAHECLPAGAATLAISGDTVQGRNFPATQPVHVVFSIGVATERTVQTDASGSFDTTLPARDPCDTLIVTASAAGGVSAIVRRLRPRECAAQGPAG